MASVLWVPNYRGGGGGAAWAVAAQLAEVVMIPTSTSTVSVASPTWTRGTSSQQSAPPHSWRHNPEGIGFWV